ncbi:MAG: FtsX-like permease family protein [Bryobacteraceae bacterium]
MIVQVALALVLLVSSGLMIRTLRALTGVNPGFVAPSEVQTFRVSIPDAQVKDPVRAFRIEEEILHKIEAVPGVSSAAFSTNIPMDARGSRNDPVSIKGRANSSVQPPICRVKFVSPGYLKTIGTPLVAGRSFSWSEIENKVPVVMISEKFARQYWREPASALGKEIRTNTKDDWRKIIGVVGDVHQDGVEKEPPASVYWPIFMTHFESHPNWGNVAFAIRSPRAGSESFIKEIRQAVRSVNPNLPLFAVHTLDYYYSNSMARTSFTLVMLALAGGMGLLLSIVGLYGVIAYSVSQRKREIGIRLALGAQAEDVQKMVVRGGFKLAALGVGIGIIAALGTTRFLASLLYGVKPTDPATFAAVSLLLLAVALLASYIPARQAAKVDPMETLRHE